MTPLSRLVRTLASLTVLAVVLASLGPAAARDGEALSLVAVAVSGTERARLLGDFDLAEGGRPGEVDVVLHPGDAERLRSLGFRWRVLVEDLAAADRAAALRPPLPAAPDVPGARTEYRRLADYEADLRALAAAHPERARLLVLPERTLEGRTVYGIEIASDVARRDGRPVFYMDGLHHAREWPAAELTVMFAHDLLESYASDARVRALMDRVRTVLVPVVNPDGFDVSRESLVSPRQVEFAYSAAGIEGYWRKNRRGAVDVVVPVTGRNPTAYGVDPNRNYAYQWGDDRGGSSPHAVAQTYRGPEPFSEPETRNVRSVILTHPVTAMITNHTYGNLILRPWGETEAWAPDEPLLEQLGRAMAAVNRYSSIQSIYLYPTTGTTDDWAYAATGVLGFTFEHGSSFHPAYGSVPAMYLANRGAFLIAAEAAGNRAYHAVVDGHVAGPLGESVAADLQVVKTFETPLWRDGDGRNPTRRASVTETITLASRAAADGAFELHLNPSTRPVAHEIERYTLVVSAPGYRTEEIPLVVARGDTLSLGSVVLRPS